MNIRYFLVQTLTLLILGGFAISANEDPSKKQEPIKLLILSGKNNHMWEETTPFLMKLYNESGRFSADETIRPDTLTYDDFSCYDIVLNNWNSWPENDLRWPKETENGLLKYLKEGGGLVFFHASSSAFYKWPKFKDISTASWLIDSTRHGKRCMVDVELKNTKHSITKGMKDFKVLDELWQNASKNPNFKVLGSAWNEECHVKQPAIMVAEIKKGRVFHTILGHDIEALSYPGVKSLMLRGAEWAASGKVTIPLPNELQALNKITSPFSWAKTDTTFALLNKGEVVWQYNYNTFRGKPFFDPVNVGGRNMTCVSPNDHVWHLGQWFSWKYINKVNYWECNKKTFKSDGETRVVKVQIKKKADFSAEIKLNLEYAPADGGEVVLTEKRTIYVSAPNDEGSVYMDYDFNFKAVGNIVVLDRTHVLGEPNGQLNGGYAGLSIRFNPDLKKPILIADHPEVDNYHGISGDWLYRGSDGKNIERVGSIIMCAPELRRKEAAWYIINKENTPMYYHSPSYIFNKSYTLQKNETLNLKYRILHLLGKRDKSDLQSKYTEHINQ